MKNICQSPITLNIPGYFNLFIFPNMGRKIFPKVGDLVGKMSWSYGKNSLFTHSPSNFVHYGLVLIISVCLGLGIVKWGYFVKKISCFQSDFLSYCQWKLVWCGLSTYGKWGACWFWGPRRVLRPFLAMSNLHFNLIFLFPKLKIIGSALDTDQNRSNLGNMLWLAVEMILLSMVDLWSKFSCTQV